MSALGYPVQDVKIEGIFELIILVVGVVVALIALLYTAAFVRLIWLALKNEVR
jgi:hypothetical protein